MSGYGAQGGSDEPYRTIFDHSAVSLWVEDIAELLRIIRELHEGGVSDLRAFLREDREAFRRAVRAITVIDVNQATLDLYEAESKEELLGPVERTLDLKDPSIIEGLTDDILAVAEGRRHIERDSFAITPSGKRLEIEIKIHIPSPSDGHQVMLVNVIDVTERKRLQAQLDEERRHYSMLIDNLPDGVYLKDHERRYLVANKALADLDRLSDPRQLIGRTAEELYPSEFADEIAEDESNVLRFGMRVERERSIVGDDGTPQWTLATKVPVRGPDGEITGIVGITSDVTALKEAEEAARRSEERYRAVIRDAPVGIFHTSIEGGLLDANPAFACMLGYDSPEELIEVITQTNMIALYADPSRRSPNIARALASSEWHHFREVFRRKDGSLAVVRLMLRSVSRTPSAPRAFEGFVEDVTEQERAREALARERSLLTALMDNLPDRIFFKDRDGRFTLVNRAQARDLGLAGPDAAIGKSPSELGRIENSEAAEEEERRIIATGIPLIEKEERERDAEGHEKWLVTTRMALRDESGSIVGTFGVSRDITIRKALQIRLIQAQRLESLAQLAAGIAHQFNNINAAVLGYAALMSNHPELPAKIEPHLREIVEAVKRSVEITARLEIVASGSQSAADPVELTEIAQSVIDRFEGRLRDQAVELRSELARTPDVRAGRGIVELVLSSLLANSLHALLDRPSRVIVVRTRERSGFAGLEVSDTGSGIRTEDLPRIFTPFYTTKGEWAAPGSPQSRVAGLGLSLAVCRSLITERDGTIEIESVEGSGTTVSVWFARAESAPDGGSSDPGGGEK